MQHIITTAHRPPQTPDGRKRRYGNTAYPERIAKLAKEQACECDAAAESLWRLSQWVRHHPEVIVMQPVLEISAGDLALWPVGEHESFLCAAGGFRVTEGTTGTVFVEPGCCNGLVSRQDVLDGSGCSYCSPVIELSVDRIRRLVADAQRDVREALRTAGTWAEPDLPAHAAGVTAAPAQAQNPAPAR
ncbi:hypothetical protein ACWDZX_13650 [Streptomyces collinus]